MTRRGSEGRELYILFPNSKNRFRKYKELIVSKTFFGVTNAAAAAGTMAP